MFDISKYVMIRGKLVSLEEQHECPPLAKYETCIICYAKKLNGR
jgi:hypothetical protein